MVYKIKIIIIGDPGVGKTSLVTKFVSGLFLKDYKASIGTNLYKKELRLDSENNVLISLWDIAGQERWIDMRRLYYKGAQGAFIVGDVTRKRTFEQIEKFWILDLKKNCENIPFILIANKIDLMSRLSKNEIEKLGEKINARYVIFTSAKKGENVEKAFKLISKEALSLKNIIN